MYYAETAQLSACTNCSWHGNTARYYGNDRATDVASVSMSATQEATFQPGVVMVPPPLLEVFDYFGQFVSSPSLGSGLRCMLHPGGDLLYLQGRTTAFSLRGTIQYPGMVFGGFAEKVNPINYTCTWERWSRGEIRTKAVATHGAVRQRLCTLGYYDRVEDVEDAVVRLNYASGEAKVEKRIVECSFCKMGTFVTAVGETSCRPCPLGGLCMGGYHIEAIPGYWKTVAMSPNVYECPFGTSCPGGLIARCADGYQGTVCGSCMEGWAQSADGCTECASDSLNDKRRLYLPAILLIVVGCALGLGLACTGGKEKEEPEKESLSNEEEHQDHDQDEGIDYKAPLSLVPCPMFLVPCLLFLVPSPFCLLPSSALSLFPLCRHSF